RPFTPVPVSSSFCTWYKDGRSAGESCDGSCQRRLTVLNGPAGDRRAPCKTANKVEYICSLGKVMAPPEPAAGPAPQERSAPAEDRAWRDEDRDADADRGACHFSF